MAGEARKPDDREAVTGRLKRPVEIGVGRKKPKGTKVTTTPGSAVAQGNLDVSAGRSPQAQADVEFSRAGQETPDVAFSRGLIPAPDAQVGGDTFILPPETLPEGTFSFEGGEQPGAGAGIGFTPEDDVAQSVGEAGIVEAGDQGVDPDTAIAEGEQRRKEIEDSPTALRRIQTASVESLDWKDKLAVAFISLAGGAIAGEAVGLGATVGGLAGGTAGLGELKQRQDEERKQGFALERADTKRTAAAAAAAKPTKLQAKAVRFANGKPGFANFNNVTGKWFDTETGEDISDSVTPLRNAQIIRVDDVPVVVDDETGEGFPLRRGQLSADGKRIIPPKGGAIELDPGAPGTTEPPTGTFRPDDQGPTGPDTGLTGQPPGAGALGIPPVTGGQPTSPGLAQRANRLAQAGIRMNPQNLEKIQGAEEILSEIETITALEGSGTILSGEQKKRRTNLIKGLQDESKDLDKRVKDDEERQRKRTEDKEDFEEKALFSLRLSGKPTDKDGNVLSTADVATVNRLSTNASNLNLIKGMMDTELGNFKKAVKENRVDDARVIGRNMAKIMNSAIGKDAVSADEADRLVGFLENKLFNITEPGPTFGIDLEAFSRQVQARSTAMGITVTGQLSQIKSITGKVPRLLPTIGGRGDFDVLPVGTEYINNQDGFRYKKTSETGLTRL